MIFNTPDRVAALTSLNPFARSADGRPCVPDELLERMKLVTSDEAWGVLERQHDYHFQFEGNWINVHPDVVLAGRAITAMMVPKRPDLHDVVQRIGEAEGRRGGQNNWVIDSQTENDVIVVDLFGKVHDGTFIGDNLATATRARAKTGIVIDGGIRDYQRIDQMADFAVFCRGIDPTAIADVTLVGVNIPIRIGQATVLPGDVVLGTRSGVTFVPPHLAEAVVTRSEDVRQRDVFGKSRLAEGRYQAGQIDVPIWEETIETDYLAWCEAQGLSATRRG